MQKGPLITAAARHQDINNQIFIGFKTDAKMPKFTLEVKIPTPTPVSQITGQDIEKMSHVGKGYQKIKKSANLQMTNLQINYSNDLMIQFIQSFICSFVYLLICRF